MLLVDTNVLVDVLEDDPAWADWSIGRLRAQSKIHPLVINPIIYAELSLTFSKVEALDQTIESMGLILKELPRASMATTLTSKGQVTIPKQIRTALDLEPGCAVEFAVNQEGEVV
ncbi:MAG: AbrB/MazE/SpoVT family DNA-binding domain-containing protein, partial [Candidatus Thermoplasmatota archaeon]|nr:AbrB/MazE/SpoVT family DNA-binding domain-containing protein [Candidatus Thermoplasmatota archaeon]